MLIVETLESGLIHTYSNEEKYIKQNETGHIYEDAIDVPNKYTYTETDMPIVREKE